jgi:uncharacterized lipoprotein YddW (UPF0748 family)
VDAWSGDFASAAKCTQLISDARAGHFNALVVQVRRRGDAFYRSLLEPRNSGISASFDPLEDLISKAHDTSGGQARIEIHAWIVTYNIWNNQFTPPAVSTPPHPYNAHPEWLTRDASGATWDGSNYALDPGHPGVQQHTRDVAMDLVARYDIDGLNWDYVRYAGSNWGYNETAVARFNALTGRAGIPSSADDAWKQFRRDQVTALVRRVYLDAIAIKPRIKLSADTITWAPGPTSDAAWYASSAAWNSVLQDWRGWMEEGILDLNLPMNYFDHGVRSGDYLNWSAFAKNHRFGRHVAIGPGLYLNAASNAIVQLREFRQASAAGNRADGVCGYVYKELNAGNAVPRAEFLAALTQPSALDAIHPPVFEAKATPPPMPWKTSPTHGHLRGFVELAADSARLDGATVRLSGPATRTLSTDANGFFGAVDLPAGSYSITATYPGLESATTHASITAGSVTSSTLALAQSAADQLIGNIRAFPGAFSGIVAWQLAQPVSCWVEYGTTPELGLSTPPQSGVSTQRHVLLVELGSAPEVFYRVVAKPVATELRSRIHSFRMASSDLIVDSTSALLSGSWIAGTSSADKWSTNYHYATTSAGSATATATFIARIETPGRYDVYAWNPGGSNRSTNAPFEIRSEAGSIVVRISQTPMHAGWRLLAAGVPLLRGTNAWVRLGNSTGESSKVVLADAVKWAYAPNQDPPPAGNVPDWWARFYFNTPIPGGTDPDLDGFSNASEFIAGTAPDDAGSRLGFSAVAAPGTGVLLRVLPAFRDRAYQLEKRAEAASGPWLMPESPAIHFEPDGSGTFLLTPPMGPAAFHRLKVGLKP